MEKYCIGIDLGGTSVKMGLLTTQGMLCEKWEIPTNTSEEGKYILKDILSFIEKQLEERHIPISEIKGMGFGVAGTVMGDGFVGAAVNLGWKNKDVIQEVKSFTGIPARITNDANAAALGELWMGSGKGYENLVLLTLGTGIGGGAVVDGKIVAGKFGGAGEFGHMPVVYDETESCLCGRVGCLEQAASATGIVRYAKRLLDCTDQSSILRNFENITAQSVFDAAKAEDELAKQVVERAGYYLGIALAVITGVLDPQAYIIGGGVSKAGQYLLDIIKKYYREKVLYLSKDTEIKLAELGNDAGIYGAAKLVV